MANEFTFKGPIIIKNGAESSLPSPLDKGRMAKPIDKGYLLCGDGSTSTTSLPKIPEVIWAAKSSIPSNIQNYATNAKEGTLLIVYE